MHSTLSSLHSTPSAVHSNLFTTLSTPSSMHSISYFTHLTSSCSHTVTKTPTFAHSTPSIIHSIQCSMHSTHFNSIFDALNSDFITPSFMHSTLSQSSVFSILLTRNTKQPIVSCTKLSSVVRFSLATLRDNKMSKIDI